MYLELFCFACCLFDGTVAARDGAPPILSLLLDSHAVCTMLRTVHFLLLPIRIPHASCILQSARYISLRVYTTLFQTYTES
jgi:hypothetical protein